MTEQPPTDDDEAAPDADLDVSNTTAATDSAADADTTDTDTPTDDDAVEGVIPEAEQPEQESEPTIPSDEELRQQAQQEAQRYYEEADGGSKKARLTNALSDLTDEVQSIRKQYQQVAQQKQKLDGKIDALGETAERVRELDADRTIMQTFKGGVNIPRQGEDEHNKLISEIESKRTDLQSEADDLAQSVKQLRATLKKAQMIQEQLQSALDGLTAVDSFEQERKQGGARQAQPDHKTPDDVRQQQQQTQPQRDQSRQHRDLRSEGGGGGSGGRSGGLDL